MPECAKCKSKVTGGDGHVIHVKGCEYEDKPETPTPSDTKCQNMCCPFNTVKLFADPVPPSCATGADADECGDFTTTPTISITVAELEDLRADLAKPSEWISADDKPTNEKVVLIRIRDLAEFGVAAAWWCPEDYKWIALDDLVQFDEEKVDWWREQISLPSPPDKE